MSLMTFCSGQSSTCSTASSGDAHRKSSCAELALTDQSWHTTVLLKWHPERQQAAGATVMGREGHMAQSTGIEHIQSLHLTITLNSFWLDHAPL
jgi:hypothetical protein